MASKPVLTKGNLSNARKILFTVTDLLDSKNIPYHLEGGTLLGIVRDKDLLPWDNDVDISIPLRFAHDFKRLRVALLAKGYKISIRTSSVDAGPIHKNDLSVIKVKPLWSYLFHWLIPTLKEKLIVLDVFTKSHDDTHTYWQAKNKVMRVANRYYQSYETVTYGGRELKVPNHYKDYLTEKYGDWRIPVKEWDCGLNELTIVKV